MKGKYSIITKYCELITVSTNQRLWTRHMVTTLINLLCFYSLYWTRCYTGFLYVVVKVYFLWLKLFARLDSIIYIESQDIYSCLWTKLYAILFSMHDTIYNKQSHKFYEKIKNTSITTFIKILPLYKYVL